MSVAQNTSTPAFTVGIAMFNREALIERAVRSVLAQTLDSLEVVVVDDGSSDGSAAVVREIDDPRLQLVRQDRSGAGAARNRAVEHGTAKWVTFLDSDDEARPDWLATLARVAAQGRRPGVVSCAAWNVAPAGQRRLSGPSPMLPFFPEVTAACRYSGTYAVRREIFTRVGGFTPDLRSSQHTELGLRLAKDSRMRGWSYAVVERALIVRYEGSPLSIRRDEAALLSGAMQLLDLHEDLYALDLKERARVRYLVAARARKVGDYRVASRYARLAFLDDRSQWKALISAGLTAVPAVWQRRYDTRSG